MGISACSVTGFSRPRPSSVVKVAASADLLGGGAGGGALGAASADPVWRRLGGGAFILRVGIQALCPSPLGLGPAAMLGGGCRIRSGQAPCAGPEVVAEEAEADAEAEADSSPVGAVETGTWVGPDAPASATTGPAGFAAPPPAAPAAAAAARAAAFAALLANSPAVRRREPSGRECWRGPPPGRWGFMVAKGL